MLVLSRKSEEAIVIGSGIKVTVLDVKGNRVRIGIEAPADVKILRGELSLVSESQWHDDGDLTSEQTYEVENDRCERPFQNRRGLSRNRLMVASGPPVR